MAFKSEPFACRRRLFHGRVGALRYVSYMTIYIYI